MIACSVLGSMALSLCGVLTFVADLSHVAPVDGPQADRKVLPEQDAGKLEMAWSIGGAYSGVTVGADHRTIYAIDRKKRCSVLDPSGLTIRSTLLDWNPGNARLASSLDGKETLIGFSTWSPSFSVFTADGKKLWEDGVGQGIDDVWPADLNGDGIDEIIVGYNGSTGLHVFSIEGQRLWHNAGIGNVWHVTAGDVEGLGKKAVISTSAQGKVHIFDAADGHSIRTLDPKLYGNMVRTAPAIPSSKGEVILVVGSEKAKKTMVAMSGEGKVHWRLEIGTDANSCTELIVSPDGALAALACMGDLLCVVDIAKGQIIARARDLGRISGVAWCRQPEGAGPLLLVCSENGLSAFKITTPKAP
jgi:WD40 repeat protein